MNFIQKTASRISFSSLVWIVGVLAVLITMRSLFSSSFFRTHDFTHAARLVEMRTSFASGEFRVRWSRNFGFGYGMPYPKPKLRDHLTGNSPLARLVLISTNRAAWVKSWVRKKELLKSDRMVMRTASTPTIQTRDEKEILLAVFCMKFILLYNNFVEQKTWTVGPWDFKNFLQDAFI